ncbi:diguanylate cyclase [Aureimonas sp. ME7]|uniref:diguanylate cyclase domain-containing protein n=1 Tax=Aureimonas sp. ME7 TaxID=2744252 RepID=UPI0015F4535F|nr:diguanylate cyclase [Aureimonas sp. ME7]
MGLILLLLGFCGASAVTLVELRNDSWAAANGTAQNLLTVFSQDVENDIQTYDRAISTVVNKLENSSLGQLEPDLQQEFLFDGALVAPYFTSILVLDRDGNVVRDAGGIPPRRDNFSDRTYFQVHANGTARGLYISAPFQRRLTGSDDVLGLSRRINAPDGSFGGVVVGTLRLSYFRALLERTTLGPQDSISLVSDRGTLVMRSPYHADQIGRDFSNTENFRNFISRPQGTFTGKSTVDGVTRVYNFARVGYLPLILNVALSYDDIFIAWREQAFVIIGILAFLCLLTTLLGLVVRREFKRRASAEAKTRESEAQYRLLADHATDLILRLDEGLTRRYVSPASRTMLGFEPGEMVDRKTRDLIHPDDWPIVERIADEATSSDTYAEAVYRLKHKAGHYVWVEGRYRHVARDKGFIVVLRDISQRKSAELELEAVHAELARRADTDGLTGLANRRRFDEMLRAEIARAGEKGAPISMLLIDVDRFKLYNDNYGHPAGDECLRRVAQAIASSIRGDDFCARYGGEEMAVILPDTNEDDAQLVGERVRRAVEQLQLVHEFNQGGYVTISVGCAMQRVPANDNAAEKLITTADRALYEAKRTGRNKVVNAASLESPTPLPALVDDKARLRAVADFRERITQDGAPDLDQVARAAAQLLDTPISFISLVGRDELTLIGRYGVNVQSAARDAGFCSYTIAGNEPMVVTDAQADVRFRDSPLVRGKDGLRYYAGAPLVDPHSGETVGAVCVLDRKPREDTSASDREILKNLSQMVTNEMK